MKKYFRMIIVLVVVILITTMGTAQAFHSKQADSTEHSISSSVFPLERWKTNYIYTDDNAGSDISIAFDPDHGQAAWVSYFNATYGSLWVAHFVGPNLGNCGPSSSWFCQ